MNIRFALELAAAMCSRWEGLYLNPYLCPAGVATIGKGSTHYENGTVVTLHDPAITPERADALLMHELKYECLPAVLLYCPQVDTAERLAALLDFTYNLGSGRLKTSTMRKKINAGKWSDVPRELMKWNKGGGVVLPGLTKRRQAECALI